MNPGEAGQQVCTIRLANIPITSHKKKQAYEFLNELNKAQYLYKVKANDRVNFTQDVVCNNASVSLLLSTLLSFVFFSFFVGHYLSGLFS